MRVRAIINPNSSNGRTRAAWPKLARALEAELGAVEAVFTDARCRPPTLTRQALHDEVDLVIAVGGDGTVNEVVNGFFAPPTGEDRPLRPATELAILMSGTGGDFRKTFELGTDLSEQVRRIARGNVRTIDVGRIDYTDHHGKLARATSTTSPAAASRAWSPTASTGPASASASAAASPSSWPRCSRCSAIKCRACASPSTTSPRSSSRQHPRRVQRPLLRRRHAHGADGRPDDGLLDVIVMHDMSTRDLLRDPNAIYRGTHLQTPKVLSLQGKRIVASPLPRPARPPRRRR